jgi:hypothetical protein
MHYCVFCMLYMVLLLVDLERNLENKYSARISIKDIYG